MTPLLQDPEQVLLERIAGVVTTDRNTHPASVLSTPRRPREPRSGSGADAGAAAKPTEERQRSASDQ
jgi:hypothetical protein